MAAYDEELVAKTCGPISADSPAGASARYEPEFEELEAEVAKLESLTAGPVNWRKVAETAALVLEQKSKDILAASFLTRGLFDQDGYRGLATGLTVMRDLVNQYWDTMFPELKRLRARAAAVGWMVEKLAQVVPDRQPGAADGDALAVCVERLDELNTTFGDKFGDQAPALGELRRPLTGYNDALTSAAAAAAPPPPAAAPPAAAPAADAPPPAPALGGGTVLPDAIASDRDAQKAIRSCQDVLRNVAAHYRGAGLANPLPFRLVRMVAWMGVERLPPAADGVTTQVREPSADRLKVFADLQQAGNHAGLVAEVETTLARQPFWLDGHRLVASALQALGHEDAHRAVIAGMAEFLRLFPGVEDLKFSSGAPFADDMTRIWLRNEVSAGGEPAGPSTAPAAGPGGETPWLDAAREAQKLAGKGQFPQGVALFQAGRQCAASTRDRFFWELELARFCKDTGHLEVAAPLLEYLDDQVERFGLDEWEPALGAEIAGLLLVCYTKPLVKDQIPPARVERTERLTARLCRLDPAAAAQLYKK